MAKVKVTIEQLTDFCNLFLDCYKEQLGFLQPGQARRNYLKAHAKHRRERRNPMKPTADKLKEITKYYADVKRKSRNYGFDKQFNTLCEGRCEGIVGVLSILGYRIVKDEKRGKYVTVQKGGTK